MTIDRTRCWAAIAAAATLSVLAACTSNSGSAGSTPPAPPTPPTTASPADSPTSTNAKAAASSNPAPCVSDVARVVHTDPAPTTAKLPAATVTKLDAAARSSFKYAAAPGAIVGVRTPDGTWTNAYGYADPSTKTPMTARMHMRIGSVTKTFTGTLMLQLAKAGRLHINDPISKYVTGIPNGNKITLAMLANMTSGIASYYTKPFLAKYFGNPDTVFTPDQLVAYGVADSPIFAPGGEFNYSNTNTILLGQVIEKVTGEPVATVLQDQILKPLGLRNTSLPNTSPAIPDPHPHGYTLQTGGRPPAQPLDATDWNPSFGWTAGAMISTVSDMLTYDQALSTGHGLLSAAAQTQRLNSIPGPAGYGLGVGCIDGWVGHTGELPGFTTTVYYDTSTDTSVVVLTNSDIPSGNCPESPTLSDNPTELPCAAPATRIFVALSKALGHEFHPTPMQ